MSESARTASWYQLAAAAVPRHFWLKSFGTTIFISLFFVAYFHVLRNPSSQPTVMPEFWLDRQIGFEPMALPVYFSLWLYVSVLPAFFHDRGELYRYGLSMTIMCVAGLAIFYAWPTAAPAPDIDWTRYPEIDFLKSIDASGNACPSLHVATAVLSAFWFHALLRSFGTPGAVLAFNWIWCAAIVYSTIAIRQHVVVDAAAGLLLGGLAAWLSLRRCAVKNPPPQVARS